MLMRVVLVAIALDYAWPAPGLTIVGAVWWQMRPRHGPEPRHGPHGPRARPVLVLLAVEVFELMWLMRVLALVGLLLARGVVLLI